MKGLAEAEKLAELAERFDFPLVIDLSSSRCPRCNDEIRLVPKDTVKDEVEKNTFNYYDKFWKCVKCEHVYWRGAHWEGICTTLAEAKKIQCKIIPRIATGLCSGMSRTSRTCGAISGAIMGLGLVHGRNTPEDDREYLYALVQELFKRFTDKHGTTSCHELIGCDLNTEEGQKYFVDQNLDPVCREITADAARIAMEIMEEGV